jgi:hypothetical protein
MWLFNIVTHCSVFLLLLATSKLWYFVVDTGNIVKEARAQPCIPLVGRALKNICQGVIAIIKPCASFVIKKSIEVGRVAVNTVCGSIWRAMWKHTSLIMFMTFMHDEVWLPFLLSMISVVIIVGLVYLPKDTGSVYIPKRHRKWSRYRDAMCRRLIKRITASSLFMYVEEFMYTKCRRSIQPRSTTLSRMFMIRMIIPATGIARQLCRGVRDVWRWFIQKLDQSQQGASGLVGHAILTVTTASRLRTALIIGAICLFASVLSVYQNEMRRKLLTIKSIINGVAMSRVMPSTAISMQFIAIAYETVCNNWSAVSRVTSSRLNWMGIVDGCSKQQTSVTTTACIYAIACCLVLLQDCLIHGSHEESGYACTLAPHQDGDEIMLTSPNEDDECFYDCDQSMNDVTFMSATTSNSPGRAMKGQGDLGLDSDSYWMAVDNCCTYCISNCLTDFIGPMTKVTSFSSSSLSESFSSSDTAVGMHVQLSPSSISSNADAKTSNESKPGADRIKAILALFNGIERLNRL